MDTDALYRFCRKLAFYFAYLLDFPIHFFENTSQNSDMLAD